MERKTVRITVKAVDEETGIFDGHASTFSKVPDSYGDVVDPGAFAKTIKENMARIKTLWNHSVMEPIGKPTALAEDKEGLAFTIQLSLGVQRARELLSLMKDGVVTEMSIGYDTLKETWAGGIRHLQEVRLWDVSPVTFAANPEAVIVNVKKATTFGDLPLADRGKEWDAARVEKRVRTWAGGEDNINWNKYRQAFFWYDEDDPELFGSYKLGFADIMNNRLTAIPRGIFAVAGVLMGARGGVDIPTDEEAAVKGHVEKYYTKMRKEFDDEDIIAPWNKAASEPSKPTGDEPFNAREWINGQLEGILAQVDADGNKIEQPAAKSGRVLSTANLEKVKKGLEALRAGLEALQALLDAAESEPEPAKATQLAEATLEAARLEGIVATLKAENEGFDAKEAERRIESMIERLRK